MVNRSRRHPRLLTPGVPAPLSKSARAPHEVVGHIHGGMAEDRQMYKMHLPHVYKAFPRMLQPLDSVAPAVLRETRGRRWRERAMRIRDDALSWTQCTREWREAEEEAAREEAEEGPNPFSHSRRYARMCKDQVDWELLNLALRIYFEGDFSEKHRTHGCYIICSPNPANGL